MCGILGQINRKTIPDKKTFLTMLETLSHRGPDQTGTHYSGKTALGYKRLAIIDLSAAGRGPMFNENKNIVIIFNGEIYNYQKLKKDLKNEHVWKSKTDTETLIHGYEDWGQKLSEKIEGMFAFAIYDKTKQLVTLSRDHFGKKPLYYYLDNDTFCFASELKALLKNPDIKKKLKISTLAMTKYLFYGYVPSPDSIFGKIKKLEPSTTFQFDIKKWKIINKYRFWKLENIALTDNNNEDEILNKAENLIKKSVKKRLMSDVPLGIFLSGGIDSSLIAAYLSQYSSKVKSYTICYKNEKEIDESAYAKRVADKLGIKTNLCYFTNNQISDNFIRISDYLDEPIADAAIIPLSFISGFAKPKITVVLSGDGGDEIFAGYPKYNAQIFIENFKYLGIIADLVKPLIPKNNLYYKLLDNFNNPFSVRQFVFGSGSFSADEVKELLNLNNIDLESIFSESYKFEKMFSQNDTLNKSLFLDCKIQLPDWYLVKGDRATMANSLEMRNPFLDKELAEYVFSLKGEWKIRNNVNKYILKKLASRYFDSDLVYRKKSGFGVPLQNWIRNELREIFEQYLFVDNGYFNLKFIARLYQEHIDKKNDHQFKLLRIFSFNYWLKNYFPQSL